MDTIKGLALIGTFIGVLIIFAMWVSLWESVWQASVEPTRGAIYETQLNRLGPSPCLRSSWMWWRSRGLSKNRDGRIWGRTFGGGHRVWFRFICLSETRPITCGAVTSRSDPVINSRRATVVDCLPGQMTWICFSKDAPVRSYWPPGFCRRYLPELPFGFQLILREA